MIHSKLQELQSKLENQTVYLVGGGESLKNFDWNYLKDKTHIAINHSMRFCENATALFWADAHYFANKNTDILNIHQCKLRFTTNKKWVESFSYDKNVSVGDAVILEKLIDQPWSVNLWQVAGNNSGAMCINLAQNCGAKKIILLGFDMGGKHFHDLYDFNAYLPPDERSYILFRQSIIKMLPHIKIPVYHGTPNSSLDCFPYQIINN